MELPPFVAMNNQDEGRLYAVGPNLLAAVKLWLYRRIGSSNLHTRKCFATVTDIAIKWNIIIERVTYELRERETRCNARTLNTSKKAFSFINSYHFQLASAFQSSKMRRGTKLATGR